MNANTWFNLIKITTFTKGLLTSWFTTMKAFPRSDKPTISSHQIKMTKQCQNLVCRLFLSIRWIHGLISRQSRWRNSKEPRFWHKLIEIPRKINKQTHNGLTLLITWVLKELLLLISKRQSQIIRSNTFIICLMITNSWAL